jgi:hypothetical protein
MDDSAPRLQLHYDDEFAARSRYGRIVAPQSSPAARYPSRKEREKTTNTMNGGSG